jgi:hypothetical protein
VSCQIVEWLWPGMLFPGFLPGKMPRVCWKCVRCFHEDGQERGAYTHTHVKHKMCTHT